MAAYLVSFLTLGIFWNGQQAQLNACHPAALRIDSVPRGALRFGAPLCLWDTYAGIAFIVAVQLNFAIAPRVRWLSGF